MCITHVCTVVAIAKHGIYYCAVGFVITNGPQDMTVCINTMAECYCGFTGANPTFAIPDWRIVFRSDNGSIVSNDTVDGDGIVNRLINGLQWVPDLTSGEFNGTNSKLLVGTVNMTHNQSSYQCIFTMSQGVSIISSVGTMTVVGKTAIYSSYVETAKLSLTDPLPVIINEEEICTTSIIISLNTHSHPSCGEVLHNVTISGNVVYPDTVGGSQYTIDGLQSDTLYNITVISTHNGSTRILNKVVRTSIPVCKF